MIVSGDLRSSMLIKQQQRAARDGRLCWHHVASRVDSHEKTNSSSSWRRPVLGARLLVAFSSRVVEGGVYLSPNLQPDKVGTHAGAYFFQFFIHKQRCETMMGKPVLSGLKQA
jgi:hypothetical protein